MSGKMTHEEIIEKMKNDEIEKYHKSLNDLEGNYLYAMESIETIDELYGKRVKGN